MFHAVGTDVSFPKLEEEVLGFWKEQRIYEKSLEQKANSPPFIFFEGPPTANGLPHPGHCLTRAIKDLFPRYRTMRGFRCERKAGWDTHGLPVEVEVCKELGIHSKDEIESYGVEPFIHRCQQSVWRYMQEWERLTERIGFWIDLSQAYVTYHQSFVESVWWSLKNLFDRGLLYRGHKIVWWWAQGGTALSSGEVGQGYREVADPSVFVRFPLENDPNTSLVVWTTTPWTLPSNQFAAVHPELNYVICKVDAGPEQWIIAEALIAAIAEKTKRELSVVETVLGRALVGRTYLPPFDFYYAKCGKQSGKLKSGREQRVQWRIVDADFVTTDSGTGIVHLAPAFGEVDYDVLLREQKRFEPEDTPTLICAVDSNGRFNQDVPDYQGQWVKDADKPIARRLRETGLLVHQEQYLHDYPFCWRADSDPLIQYPRESWFIRTTAFRDAMLANNKMIQWLPEHIRDGRFGNFLESNVDWALSRERYWGTPLPIWVCEITGKMEAVGNYSELLSKPGVRGMEVWEAAKKKNPELVDDLKVHKPYIDAITYDSPFLSGARMRRVSEVIDCWYDSGAMPFAQWGYPHLNQERFQQQFPADFISEAIDQTRGWFYSQLAISTMLFGSAQVETARHESALSVPYPHPFKNCIVLGLMLAEWYETRDGKQRFLSEEEAKAAGADVVSKVGKMSKSLRNYRSPHEIFDRYGADALRWYFFANQPPWNSIVYSERAIRDSIPEFLLRLWNVLSFFTIYAEIDGFDGPSGAKNLDQLSPQELESCSGYRPISERSELDRWMISELNETIRTVTDRMDRYDNYGACQRLYSLVDGLSNWFVRRSRSRFWAEDKTDPEKLDAYWTLYESLITISKLIAPFVPFIAESIWKQLTPGLGCRESVHLCDYPMAVIERMDANLSKRMATLREIASLGRSARMNAKLKVRQPLSKVEVVLVDETARPWLEEHDEILRDELNVKEIHYASGSSPYIEYQVVPNFRILGPKLGPNLPKVKQLLAQADGRALLHELKTQGKMVLSVEGKPIELEDSDVQVRLLAKAGWAAEQGNESVVILSTELDDSLIREGIAKDLIRSIQDLRKKRQLRFTDRITLFIATESEVVQRAIEEHRVFISRETLAENLQLVPTLSGNGIEVEVGDDQVRIDLRVAVASTPE